MDEQPDGKASSDKSVRTIPFSPSPGALRLRLAFELFEAGVNMERQRLRRLLPKLDDTQVEERLRAWLHRVGEPGDSDGVVRPWPGETG